MAQPAPAPAPAPPPTPAPIPHRTQAIKGCCWGFCVCIAIFFLFVVFASTWFFTAIQLTNENNSVRRSAWLGIQIRTYLLNNPKDADDRGFFWNFFDQALRILWDFPTFFLAYRGDFLQLRESAGELRSPFMNGWTEFDHAIVARELSSTEQHRGRYIGSQKVIEECFGEETLIFVSSGQLNPRHDYLKGLIKQAVRGFRVNETAADIRKKIDWMKGPALDPKSNPSTDEIRKYLIATMWLRLFEHSPEPELVAVFESYFMKVIGCIFGETLPALVSTVFPIRDSVKAVRDRAYAAAAQTPLANSLRQVLDKANAEATQCVRDERENCPLPVPFDELLMQVVDGYLFAGLLGTDHHVSSVIKRVRSDPKRYFPMFKQNPRAFMVENARLDPPVASITALSREPKTVLIGSGHASEGVPTRFPAEVPYHLVIMTANRDPTVFGLTANIFDPTRPTLNKTLSWNGVEELVAEGRSPRGCPGHDLALDVTTTFVEYFCNENSPPSGEIPPGDQQPSKLRLKGEPLLFQRLAARPQPLSMLMAFLLLGVLASFLYARGHTHTPEEYVKFARTAWSSRSMFLWGLLIVLLIGLFVGGESMVLHLVCAAQAAAFLLGLRLVFTGALSVPPLLLQRLSVIFERPLFAYFIVFLVTGFFFETFICYLFGCVMLVPALFFSNRPIRRLWKFSLVSLMHMLVGFLTDKILLTHLGVVGFSVCLVEMAVHALAHRMHPTLRPASSRLAQLCFAATPLAVFVFVLARALGPLFFPLVVDNLFLIGFLLFFYFSILLRLLGGRVFLLYTTLLEGFLGGIASMAAIILTIGAFALGEYFVPVNAQIASLFALLCLVPFYVAVLAMRGFQLIDLACFLSFAGCFAHVLFSSHSVSPLVILVLVVTAFFLRRCINDLNRQCPQALTLFAWLVNLISPLNKPLKRFAPVVMFILVLGAVLFVSGVPGVTPGVVLTGDVCGDTPQSERIDLCQASPVRQVDVYTRLLFLLMRQQADQHHRELLAEGPPPSSVIRVPLRRGELPMVEITRHPSRYIPNEDEDMLYSNTIDRIVLYLRDLVLHSPAIFPLHDQTHIQFPSAEIARQTLYLAGGPLRMDPVYVPPQNDLTSDWALTKWAFYGLGAHLLRRTDPNPAIPSSNPPKPNEAYVIDLLWMYDLEVREPFLPYGAAAFFDDQKRVTRIVLKNPDLTDYYPTSGEWKFAKFVWRSSLLVGVTLKDHLVTTHLKVASAFVTANREMLPTLHPIRRLLTPFTYRTIEINSGAASNLCLELGVLHRAVGLSYRGLETGFDASFKDPWVPMLRDQLAQNLTDVVPFVEDGQDFHQIIRKLVSGYVYLYYPKAEDLAQDKPYALFLNHLAEKSKLEVSQMVQGIADPRDRLVVLLTELIAVVTGYHYQVGHVNEYVLDPEAASGKLQKGVLMADVQTSIQTMVIAIFTSFPEPMLMGTGDRSPFSHLLLPGENNEQAKALFDQFQKDLRNFSQVVQQRNKNRPWAFESFNPEKLMTAVSI